MPTNDESDYNYATISMDMFLNLKPNKIKVMKLNTTEVYTKYINNSQLDVENIIGKE